MKLRQFSLILTLGMLLTLAGASMLNAGERCCVLDESGQCVPCDPATTSASVKPEAKAQQVNANATFAQAGSVSMIPVRVVTADGKQRVVTIPANVLASMLAKSGGACNTSCAPQNCDPQTCDPADCDPQNCRLAGTRATGAEAGAKRICVPSSQCGNMTAMPAPTPKKTSSTSDADTSI